MTETLLKETIKISKEEVCLYLLLEPLDLKETLVTTAFFLGIEIKGLNNCFNSC